MSIKSKILSRFSYIYRIKNGYGLEIIRNKRELKAIINFCKNTACAYRECGFTDSSNLKVWEKTVKLYDNKNPEKLVRYIEDHIGNYWS